jgi:magnesium transporter
MLKVHRRGDALSDVAGIGQDAIWIDLLNPNSEEKRSVERLLDVEIPDEESLSEIEASSRMISEHGKLYLSSPAVRVDDHGDAYLTPIGFVIGADA